jgi:hypothetical protein
MRSINPTASFVALPFEVPAGPPTLAASFAFPQDSVLHWVSSNVQMGVLANGRVIVAAGLDLLGFNGGVGSALQNTQRTIHSYLFEDSPAVTVPAFTVQRNHTEMQNMLVTANSKFNVIVFKSGVPGDSEAFGTFNLSYTPLSEWVNFREPRVAVRL